VKLVRARINIFRSLVPHHVLLIFAVGAKLWRWFRLFAIVKLYRRE
jgi:hypothetical protein